MKIREVYSITIVRFTGEVFVFHELIDHYKYIIT